MEYIDLNESDFRNLLVYCAREGKILDFQRIYQGLYKGASIEEMYRVIAFIRLSSNLDFDFR